ncbi:MAG: DUF3782 domain-containing protein [Candidatus Competibacteraceae bacterium]|nr:MAG: DUF3782 domain-containing protein [Candidatus Competibacteraceae bacterium]
MATTYEEVLNLFKAVAEAQRETERLLREQTQETDRKFQDTDRKIKAVTTAIGDLGNRLGEFVEGLVRPAVVRLFRERGIAVHEVYPDVEVDRAGEELEIDLLVVNDAEAVLVEVKSKLTQADVDDHLERLGKFKRLMPRYANVRAFGAVAAMVVPHEVGRYAYRKGLYVLAQAGDSVVILNDARFQPKAW